MLSPSRAAKKLIALKFCECAPPVKFPFMVMPLCTGPDGDFLQDTASAAQSISADIINVFDFMLSPQAMICDSTQVQQSWMFYYNQIRFILFADYLLFR
jgi:hypothetical protein